MGTYSLGDAARILKVAPSRLRYWERTALLKLRAELGTRPGFEFRDLVCVKAILQLLDHGVPLRRIRRSIEILREEMPDLDDPVGSLRLWAEGSERVVVQRDGVLIQPDGQLVLDFRGASDALREVTTLEHDVPTGGGVDDAPTGGAIEWFERGCRLDSDPETFAQAIAAYEKSIEIDPHFADAHCNLGAALYNHGRRAPARRCFERCLELESRHVEAHFNLANLLEEEGRNEMALRHYRAALDADPFYSDLHINLALLYEKLGLARRARDHWRRYLQLDTRGAWADVARQRLEESKS